MKLIACGGLQGLLSAPPIAAVPPAVVVGAADERREADAVGPRAQVVVNEQRRIVQPEALRACACMRALFLLPRLLLWDPMRSLAGCALAATMRASPCQGWSCAVGLLTCCVYPWFACRPGGQPLTGGYIGQRSQGLRRIGCLEVHSAASQARRLCSINGQAGLRTILTSFRPACELGCGCWVIANQLIADAQKTRQPMGSISCARKGFAHLILQGVSLVVVGGAVQRDNDHVGLAIAGACQCRIGRPQPGAIRGKGLAGGKVGRFKCACSPEGLVREPAPRLCGPVMRRRCEASAAEIVSMQCSPGCGGAHIVQQQPCLVCGSVRVVK